MRGYTTSAVITVLFSNTPVCNSCWTCSVEDIQPSKLITHRQNLPCSELDQYTPIACDNVPRCKQFEGQICWVDHGISTDFNAECQLGYQCVILEPEPDSWLDTTKTFV